MTVGERIRELRGARSQEVCAKACQVTRSAWNQYEHNDRTPRDEVKIRIARLLGVSVQDLFFNEQYTK